MNEIKKAFLWDFDDRRHMRKQNLLVDSPYSLETKVQPYLEIDGEWYVLTKVPVVGRIFTQDEANEISALGGMTINQIKAIGAQAMYNKWRGTFNWPPLWEDE